MDFTTIRNVELLSVGMRWRSVNGELTFTFEHLADAVRAANDDPHVTPARIKIGHSDPRFTDPEDVQHDPFWDGEPALGSVENLRLENDGSMLVGDFVDVPVWLAEAMPTAYPSRSIEGAWSMKTGAAGEPEGTWDVTTPGGKSYSFVLTGCALLGLSRPAIENLEDLRWYLSEGGGLVVAGAPPAGGQPVAASMGHMALVPEMAADVENVVEDFCHNFAPDPAEDAYWWWPIALETDSGILYADDDEGGIQAIPYTTDADQNVSFGEPYRVIRRYEEAPATAALATAVCHGNPAVIFRSPRETPLAARWADRDKGAVAGGQEKDATLRGMPFSDDQVSRMAAKLGLTEESSEQEFETAVAVEDQTPEAEEAPAEETQAEAEETEEETPPVASAPTVTMDAAAHADLVAKAEKGVAALARQEADDRAAILTAAVKAGKIMPSSRPDWERKLVAAPEATKQEIESLAEGLVPVDAPTGSSAAATAAASDQALADEITRQFFPGVPTASKETL